jgi:hypothetical protein
LNCRKGHNSLSLPDIHLAIRLFEYQPLCLHSSRTARPTAGIA